MGFDSKWKVVSHETTTQDDNTEEVIYFTLGPNDSTTVVAQYVDNDTEFDWNLYWLTQEPSA